ncbi:MAG TPA: patatin family protein [Treponemataceae bacterium]|nr:patatin family protein [Treponemataceae bacterium]
MSFSIKAEAAVVKEKNFFLCERLINMVVLCIMKTGLVLEGGGMRGMYTAGVIDILMENNVSVNIIIGVSAGAAFGCNFKSKQIGRVIRYNAAYCKNPHYAGFRSLLFTGDFYGAKFCYDDIPNKLDPFDTDTFNKSHEEFYAVCTDVLTGKAVYHKCETGSAEDIQWMRASASMPLVSRIVRLDGMKLLDGGVADSIPLAKAEEFGCTKNIVVLTQMDGYTKKENPLMGAAKILYRKYPEFIKAMAHRHLMYNEELALVKEAEEKKKAFVFRPSRAVHISRTERNPDNLRTLYALGREDALNRLSELKEFLR